MPDTLYDSDEKLKDLEKSYAAPSSTESGSQKLAEQKGLEDAYAAPAATTSGSQKTAGAKELSQKEDAAADDTVGNGFSSEKKKNSRMKGWMTKKRVGIAGGIAGVGLGGGLLGLTMISGPLQFIHLSENLLHSFSKNESDSSNRMGKLFRYARAVKNNDFGETRVGVLGSKVFGTTIEKLNNMGIEIARGPTGAPTKTTFNTETMKATYPELNGMTDAEAKTFLADKLKINPDIITGSGGKFAIDQGSFSLRDTRFLTKNTTYLLGDGKISSGIKTRELTKFFNLPSLLHPLSRAVASAENKYLNAKATKATAAEEEKAGQAVEEAKFAATTEPLAAQADGAANDIKSTNNTLTKGITGALLLSGGACVVYDTAGSIIKINHARVVLPAAAQAMSLIATGEQIKAGGADVTNQELALLNKNFVDNNGQSIWQGQALESLSSGSYHTGDPNLPADYKQAFSSSTTAASLQNGINTVFSTFGISAADACSTAGLIVQGAITLAISGASLFGEVVSAGTATPAIIAEQAAFWSAKEAAGIIESGVALHFIQRYVISKTTVAILAADAFRGPVGGDLLAYGSRAAANVASIASGGIDLGNQASTVLAANESSANRQQFQSESFFARMFNVYDSRSLIGHLADSMSPSFAQNATTIGNSFLGMGSTLSHIFSSMLPKAAAATTYNWGFPQYGLPQSMLNDPAMSDPYANASAVAKIFDAACLNKDGSLNGCSYISKIDTCFGDSLTHNSTPEGIVWDVTAQHDVNPSDSTYIAERCNDISDATWKQIVMFVFDTNTMKSAACYEGNQTSCADEGMGTTTSPSSPPNNAVTGDAATLAQQVLKNTNITRGPTALADLQAAANNQKVTPGPIGGAGAGTTGCSARTPVYLDATLLQAMLNIAQQYKYQIQDIVSGHNCDTGRHPLGRAMDIFQLDGEPINGHCGDQNIKDFTNGVTTIMSRLLPAGKFVNGNPVNMAGIGACSQNEVANPPANINYFFDSPDQLHVDVGVPS